MEIRLPILFIPELETLKATLLIFLLFSALDGFREIRDDILLPKFGLCTPVLD